jgi:ferredoxin
VIPVLPRGTEVAVVTGRCQGCGACLLTCPERAIRPGPVPGPDGGGPLAVLAGRCTGCGDCVEVCPVDAIELRGIGMGGTRWEDSEGGEGQ